MNATGTPADPIAKGVWPTAKQSWSDLFKWQQRTVVSSEDGETYCEWQNPPPLQNPFKLAASLSAKAWLFYIVGLTAWMADAFDFHGLSIQTVKLAAYFKTSNTNVTTAITLTLLLRTIGAACFGLAGDRFGRKWPMVINMIVLGVLQVGTIYASNFSTFLGVRALFGLFMGGVYGNASAMALENCPTEARGLLSGIFQQGYSLGFLLSAIVNLCIGGSTDSWKIMFWVGTGLSTFVGIVRMFFPESSQFIEAKETRRGKPISASAFWIEAKIMLFKNWRMFIYCVILMTWFNCYAHTSQDSYMTFMLTQKELANGPATRASIWMTTGSCVGGIAMGYVSQFVGRRRTIILCALMSGFMIPAWILPDSEGALSATGFILQFWVQGAFGIIPVHLIELSPPAFRSTFPGITYQLGNMISSASTQIVNAIAGVTRVHSKSGKLVDAYGPTMAVATAFVVVAIVITVAFGPERRGVDMEASKVAGEVVEKQRELEGASGRNSPEITVDAKLEEHIVSATHDGNAKGSRKLYRETSISKNSV